MLTVPAITYPISDTQLEKWEAESRIISELNTQASKSKKHLLEFIEFFHDQLEDEYRDADFLVDSHTDIIKWLDIWNSGSDDEDEMIEDIFDVNRLFRVWKMQQYSTLSNFEEFKELLFMDRQDWVETYFQQRFFERIDYELNIVLNDLSVEDIWKVRLEFPFVRVEQIMFFNSLVNDK